MKGRVLIIAGSDSGGGAGIQADVKTVTALDGYAATAISALTAQDTRTVHAIHDVPVSFIRLQIELVLTDIGADALKTGMLSKPEVIDAVREEIDLHAPGIPLVVDPVMVAKGGTRLLDTGAERALIERLLPLMPDPSLDSFFFWNSGSEAVEAAIKMSRIITGRQNIITMQGAPLGRNF